MKLTNRRLAMMSASGATMLVALVGIITEDLIYLYVLAILVQLSLLFALFVVNRNVGAAGRRIERKIPALSPIKRRAAAAGAPASRQISDRPPGPPRAEALLSQGRQELDRELAKSADSLGTRAPAATYSVGFSPEKFYGRLHVSGRLPLERLTMRNGSLTARDAIAFAASGLELSSEELIRLARARRADLLDRSADLAMKRFHVQSLLSLARVLMDQGFAGTDHDDALALFELVLDVFGTDAFPAQDTCLFLESVALSGDRRRYLELAETFQFAKTEPLQFTLHECNYALKESSSEAQLLLWIGLLREQYVEAGYAPIELESDTKADLLGRLTASAPSVDDGPIVTVLMPTFNGSEWIETAARSVLLQTWRCLELIIIDDGSDEAHASRVREIVRTLGDDRVTLVHQRRSQGPYVARNRGLGIARGEFVTVHDDDDWSHPQKIETQVKHLLEAPTAIANTSYGTRIDEDHQFIRINDNPWLNQKNYSSLMIRRETLQALGGWQAVRKSADAELHDRIRALWGRTVEGVISPPLSFFRARHGSLTHNEMRRGALDPGRHTYGLLFSSWHTQIRDGLRVDSRALEQLPHPVPWSMNPANPPLAGSDFAMVLVADLRHVDPRQVDAAFDLCRAERGRSGLAIAHLDSPAGHRENQLLDVVARIEALCVPVVALNEVVATEIVVVLDPTILQFADNLRSGFRTSTVVIVVEDLPITAGGKRIEYDLAVVAANARRMFGAEVRIAPTSHRVRAGLEALYGSAMLGGLIWSAQSNSS